MTLEVLIREEMPPFTAHPPNALHPFLVTTFVTKTMKTGVGIVQSRVKLYPRHLPEVAAGGN